MTNAQQLLIEESGFLATVAIDAVEERSEGVDAVDMLSDLRVKAGHVQWNRLDRREVYVLFARSFKGRLDEPDVLMYDIDDIREMVENRA